MPLPLSSSRSEEKSPLPPQTVNFSQRVLLWFEKNGRKTLPWQQQLSPYRVWVSEVMLQQTQVATVIPYFNRFTATFPTVEKLATGNIDDVLHLWSGLGYYSRARNLHKAAQQIMHQYSGRFPKDIEQLTTLSGIGRSTAGAIASISMNIPAPILDGNVRRVLTRHFAVSGWPGKSSIEKQLWLLAEKLLPMNQFGHYTQAMMDLGATVCTRTKPHCTQCPLKASCIAYNTATQSFYPTPKPKKSLPTKEIYMLMLTDPSGRTLLKKRPSRGIWGGLWSLPEYSHTQEAEEAIASLQPVTIKEKTLWPTFRHSFSHYHLHITPVQAFTDTFKTFTQEETQWYWYNPHDSRNLGLPAPIKTLLDKLYRQL